MEPLGGKLPSLQVDGPGRELESPIPKMVVGLVVLRRKACEKNNEKSSTREKVG